MNDAPLIASGSVTRQPLVWLRSEGLAALVVFVFLYAAGGHSWVTFAVLFLAPDISFAGYWAGPRAGALCYNIAHTYVVPIVLGVVLHALRQPLAVPLIWLAHIGFDRLLGYGLKYDTGFAFTHLGRLDRYHHGDDPQK